MNNDLIIVIVGETGSGKSWIMRDILSNYPNIKVIKKYTTRKSRVDEGSSIETQGNTPIEEVEQMEYTYVNPKNHELYGFKAEDITSALERNLIPCLGMSNEEVYLKLVKDYSDKRILILKVEPYFDEESMKDTFERQGRDPIEFEQRKSVLDRPLTSWAYNYKNMREIINPYFLRNCPPENSKGVIIIRLENVLQRECKANLGASFMDNGSSLGLYNYLYNYSKNKPVESPLEFSETEHQTK